MEPVDPRTTRRVGVGASGEVGLMGGIVAGGRETEQGEGATVASLRFAARRRGRPFRGQQSIPSPVQPALQPLPHSGVPHANSPASLKS